MANDSDSEALRAFLETVRSSGRVRLELDVEVEEPDGSPEPTLELVDGTSMEEQLRNSVLLRAESDEDPVGWVAGATWTEDGALVLDRARRAGSDASTLKHSRSSYRVAVPPSSVAALRRSDDTSVSVEPVDISRGGIGLRVDDEPRLTEGEDVEVSLNIPGEFDETLPGSVAFVYRDRERDQFRIGVSFDDLETRLEDALRAALNEILLGTTREIT